MVVKSVIAGTVLSLMAGGVVYFGTDIDAASVKDTVVEKTAEIKADISDNVMAGGKDHPHTKKDVEDKAAKSSADMPSVKTSSGKTIEAKKPTISSSADTAETKTAEAAPSEQPQKKWLSQYLKSEKAEAEKTEVEAKDDDMDVAKELMDSMGLTKDGGSDSDTGTFIIEGESELTEDEIETAEAKGFADRAMETENIWVENQMSEAKPGTRAMLQELLNKNDAVTMTEDNQKKVIVKVVNDSGAMTTETETIDMGDGKVMKIVKKTVTSESSSTNDKDMHIRIFTNEDGEGGISAEEAKRLKRAMSTDISATVKVVMEQAAKIEMPELRDRAYLDLVSYGLENGDYDVAATALKKIEQVELRDTARNRMAVAYAREGNAEDAFGILDDLEVDALRDVMRLQVIEAMIAPDALPEDMQ
jgi:hypothetical protein